MQNIANTFGNCKACQAIFQAFLSHPRSVGGLCCCAATLTFAAKRRNWRIPGPSALSRRHGHHSYGMPHPRARAGRELPDHASIRRKPQRELAGGRAGGRRRRRIQGRLMAWPISIFSFAQSGPDRAPAADGRNNTVTLPSFADDSGREPRGKPWKTCESTVSGCGTA